MVSLRLTVTSSLQGSKGATHYINVTGCGLAPNSPKASSGALINAYPNPSFGGSVNLSLSAVDEISSDIRIEILDQFGKTVKRYSNSPTGNSSVINLAENVELPLGI
jgi:hypothetical protein